MTFCPQLAPGTISLTSDLVLGDDSEQYRCYIGKIVNKQNIFRDRIPRSRLSYAYTLQYVNERSDITPAISQGRTATDQTN